VSKTIKKGQKIKKALQCLKPFKWGDIQLPGKTQVDLPMYGHTNEKVFR